LRAEALYLQALDVAEAGERSLLIATASNNLASLYAQEGRMPEAIRLFERALQLRKAYAGENSEATLNSIQRLEAAHLASGR
jgi:tetratricopeptide (TPR) repeat protein